MIKIKLVKNEEVFDKMCIDINAFEDKEHMAL
jgi:hypothetical protein